jgi:hypothetical protein
MFVFFLWLKAEKVVSVPQETVSCSVEKAIHIPEVKYRTRSLAFAAMPLSSLFLCDLVPHHCDVGAWRFEATLWSNLQGPKCPFKNIHSSVRFILHWTLPDNGIIFVNRTNLVHIFFLNIFIAFFYMFRATMYPSSGENTVPMRHLVFVTLYRSLSSMQVGIKENGEYYLFFIRHSDTEWRIFSILY